jgi:hypothetical protein
MKIKKLAQLLLGAISVVAMAVSVAVLVIDQIYFSEYKHILPLQLGFLSWFWGWFELPSAFYPLLLLLAGACGLAFATRD